MSIHTTAASALHAHIGGTQTAVASQLGEHRTSWCRYLAGSVHPSGKRVRRWAEAAGVRLAVGADGWEVLS